jgi:hypothetical protein
MTLKELFALYGRIGLILASFGIIGGVVAQPLIRPLWAARLTVAQRYADSIQSDPPYRSAADVGRDGVAIGPHMAKQRKGRAASRL